MLTLDQIGISEADWSQMPPAGRIAIMFLLKQNQLLENRNYTYILEVEWLKTKLERLKTRELEVAELRERLGQNSQNSSKPPSSDAPSVSRLNNRQPSGRKRGGQPGHQVRILAGRGQAEAREMIGKGFSGIVSTDRYAAYHWVDGHRRQLCWAHLKRDFLAIKQRGGVCASLEVESGSICLVPDSG